MIELFPVVKIACIFGGYIVEAACDQDEDGEFLMKQHTCLSVDEIMKHVKASIEMLDARTDRENQSLEDALKSKAKKSKRT